MKTDKPKVKSQKPKITDLKFDDKNLNLGTEDGNSLIEHSVRKLGMGRSILVDKHDNIIAGNKTTEGAIKAGVKNVRIIETTGDELIVVKRTDIDLNSKAGREMAIADNQTSEVNYVLNEETAMEVISEHDISAEEWMLDLNDEDGELTSKEVELKAFEKTHVLISFPPEKMIDLQDLLEQIRSVEGVEMEQSSN